MSELLGNTSHMQYWKYEHIRVQVNCHALVNTTLEEENVIPIRKYCVNIARSLYELIQSFTERSY